MHTSESLHWHLCRHRQFPPHEVKEHLTRRLPFRKGDEARVSAMHGVCSACNTDTDVSARCGTRTSTLGRWHSSCTSAPTLSLLPTLARQIRSHEKQGTRPVAACSCCPRRDHDPGPDDIGEAAVSFGALKTWSDRVQNSLPLSG